MPDLDHPTQSASLKRDGPDGTVVWKPGDIFKSNDRHSPTYPLM
jgi:hypothetical protein